MEQQAALEILIVDDDDVDRLSIKRALKSSSRPINISEADTGALGLKIFESKRFDVLLIDYRLPDVDGLSLLGKFSVVKVKDMAIVMLSRQEDETLADKALDAGAHDFLLKDEVNSRRLLRAIRQAQHRHVLELQLNEQTETAQHLAKKDSLTGLANRYTFEQILYTSLARALRMKRRIGVLFLDLDNFKKINDTLGHQIGDALLKEVARRLQLAVRDSDFLARLGGDEFVILALDVEHDNVVVYLANRIITALSQPMSLNTSELAISTSIGISVLGTYSNSASELMKCADIAMYRAKQNGRNQYCLYSDVLHHEVHQRATLEHDLRQALAGNQFVLYYQPQINSLTNSVGGVEALLRWNHPVQGILPPSMFIHLAEELGFMNEIGAWVLKTACHQLREWQIKLGAEDLQLSIAVNLSAMQLQGVDLLSVVESVLDASDLNPHCLELEITENALIRDPESIAETLWALAEKNIKLSLDDFGTGYSSIQHLHLFPIHSLKIDKGFVAAIGKNEAQDRLLIAMIKFAKTLDLKVIAEGVETPEQLDFCNRNGCDLIQGYYYSKPVSVAEFETRFLTKLSS